MSYADAPAQLADCAGAIPRHLAEAVRAQATYGDQPDRVGAFLSGGTDSSAISLLLGEALERPARTFSIGFAERITTSPATPTSPPTGVEPPSRVFVTAEDIAAFLRCSRTPTTSRSAILRRRHVSLRQLAREPGVDALWRATAATKFRRQQAVRRQRVFEIYIACRAGSARAASSRCCSPLPCPAQARRQAAQIRAAGQPAAAADLLRLQGCTALPARDLQRCLLDAVRVDAPVILAGDRFAVGHDKHAPPTAVPRSQARHHGQRSAQGRPMCALAGIASAIRCSIGGSSSTPRPHSRPSEGRSTFANATSSRRPSGIAYPPKPWARRSTDLGCR